MFAAYLELGSVKRAAHALDIELGTASVHLSNLYARLGVASALQAVRKLRELEENEREPKQNQ